MPVGIGGLFTEGLGGSLDPQVARLMAGQPISPAPNPNALQSPTGAPGPASAAPGPNGASPSAPAPGQTPAQTYAPDPQNASTIDLLLKVHQQDLAASGINHGLALMAASFGTAEQQRSKMASLNEMAGPDDNRLKALGEIQGIQAEQTKQAEHAKFMASADLMGQQLLGLKPGQGAWLANSGQLPEIMQSHFRAMEPTEAIKNYDQARAEMKKQGMTDDQINQIMPPETLTLGPGADIGQRQYIIEKTQAAARGDTTFPDYETWKTQHAEKSREATADAANIAAAGKNLPSLNSTLDEMEKNINKVTSQGDIYKGIAASSNKQRLASQIFNYKPESGQTDPAIFALQTGGLNQAEVNFVTTARQLHLANYAAGLKGGTVQRMSQQEADRLSKAADQMGDFSADPETYMSRANVVGKRVARARSTAYGEAHDYNNLPVDRRADLDPSFFEGGTNAPLNSSELPGWARPKTIKSKEDYAILPMGQSYKDPQTGRILIKGYEKKMLTEDY